MRDLPVYREARHFDYEQVRLLDLRRRGGDYDENARLYAESQRAADQIGDAQEMHRVRNNMQTISALLAMQQPA
jgi:hypothetical protein